MRYFIGFIAVIALVVMVAVLVIRGLGGEDTSKQLQLPKYNNTNTVVRLTIDAPINADQSHQAVRITISQTDATAEVLHGYDQTLVASQSYPSSSAAYDTFLRALQRLNFTRGNSDPAKSNERGYCPEGDRYIFEVIEGSRTLQRYWETSCGDGTFKGDTKKVLNLFKAQIPDYSKLTRDVDF